jgi:hypothetical protein
MSRSALGTLGMLLSLLAAGCTGDSGTAERPVTADRDDAPAASDDSPAEVVSSFLDAIRKGREADARDLLTATAQERTAALDIEIAPPWDEQASYEVGETELQDNGVAHVGCVLSDGEESLNIVWALRQEPSGWRVAGLATKVFDDQEAPIVLNYEDPEEMLRQFEDLEQMAVDTELDEDAAEMETAELDEPVDEPRRRR